MTYFAWPFSFQVLDNNGAPAAGAQVFCYVAGQDSPSGYQTTYSTATGTANTNPVVADGYGRISIFIPSETAYHFVVKSSDSSQTFLDEDNVQVPGSGGGGGGSTLPSFQLYQNYNIGNNGTSPPTMNAGVNYSFTLAGSTSTGGTYTPGYQFLYENIPASGSVFTWDDTANGIASYPLTLPQGLYQVNISFQLEAPYNWPGSTTDGYFEIRWNGTDYQGVQYVIAQPIIQSNTNTDRVAFTASFQTFSGDGSGDSSTAYPQFTCRYSNELNLYGAFVEININITQLAAGSYPGN